MASRWNRGITKAEVAASVRAVLVPLFDDLMDDHRLAEEIEHAWETCVRKWKEPTSVDEVTITVPAPDFRKGSGGVETEAGKPKVSRSSSTHSPSSHGSTGRNPSTWTTSPSRRDSSGW